MKKIMIAAFFILFLAGTAGAADGAFEKADRNKDGKIDQSEFEKAVDKKFREYDKNKDGVLDLSEMRDVHKSHRDMDVEKEFKDMDSNQDGKVDLKEFKDSAKKRFQEHDRNGDGVVDRPEIDFRSRYQDPASVMRPFDGFYF